MDAIILVWGSESKFVDSFTLKDGDKHQHGYSTFRFSAKHRCVIVGWKPIGQGPSINVPVGCWSTYGVGNGRTIEVFDNQGALDRRMKELGLRK